MSPSNKKTKIFNLNELAILYFAVDNLLFYLEDNDLVEIKKDGIYFKYKPKSEISKASRMILDDTDKILRILGRYIDDNPTLKKIIMEKISNITKGFEKSKVWSEFTPVLVALFVLDEYANNWKNGKKMFEIHPKRIEKIIKLLKEKAEFKYLDKFVLNSSLIAKKFYEGITK